MTYIIEIPYASKAYLESKASKDVYSGKAYIFINSETGKSFHQFALLNEGFTYRMTDNLMRNTSYWNSKKVVKCRELFLDNLNDNQIIRVNFTGDVVALNEYIVGHFDTVLSTDCLVKGSNPNGSISKQENSPIVIFDEENSTGLNYHWFVNFFNAIYEKTANWKKKKL
ncbi:hypothetical protein SCLARK_001377 [Spiroplasma clarkii]|uniref:MAG4270 family putative restriction endonuclease n=1 Tax=Spiroplasma clarkii TaxID=2139 RepID=UPI000B567990|nr:hypothetical protein [Spiroplasma clarkii]ARU91904.1 hypothetical protein SCLARK_001377 [Spiroplasma clarkii]